MNANGVDLTFKVCPVAAVENHDYALTRVESESFNRVGIHPLFPLLKGALDIILLVDISKRSACELAQ